jgi:ubiquinone/menaquinone biosynthesis C-methylase UbiE
MSNLTIGDAYRHFVKRLTKSHDHDRAMEIAVGGQFEAVGQIEREILIHYGLQPDGYVIDVGCGSGRLAKPLAQYLKGPYLGIDVVPELVKHAEKLAARRDWRFEVASGLKIPEKGDRADIVCFFSVFTHLLHEQSYEYLKDAKRVTKPGGRIIFSFLEFLMPSHWNVFEGMLAGPSPHLNMFMSRDGIHAWASHLDLDVVAIADGEKPQVPIRQPITFEDGRVTTESASLGQSLCVLRKR